MPKPNLRTVNRQKLLAGVDIFEQSIVVSLFKNRGEVERSFVDLTELIKMLGGLGQTKPQWNHAAKNVLAVGTKPGGEQLHIVYRPARATKICCEIGGRARTYKIQMPELIAVLSATIKNKKSAFKNIKYVFACKIAGKVTEQTQLHVPPLPNVYSDGGVCMGSVKTSQWADLPADEFFEKAFFATAFTDHIDGDQLEGKKYRNILHAIKETRGRIPLKLLKKVKKYGQIFKS
ncbi:MAG: hypothetical protein WC454_10485 [Phycisphaerae bacterium]